MTRIESRADNFSDDSKDKKMRLWITLVVTTLMVALTAYVLSFAILGPGNPPPHRSASAMLHFRS
jgi:flagellar basal body-associated protein FliL